MNCNVKREVAKAARSCRQHDGVGAEIDQLVYQIYELTPEEIAVVEGAQK